MEFLGSTLASHFLAEVGTNVCLFATGTVRANMTASISVRVHVCLTCLLFGMLIFRSPLACVGLAYMFCFLVPLSVWHGVIRSSLSCSGLAGEF